MFVLKEILTCSGVQLFQKKNHQSACANEKFWKVNASLTYIFRS